MKLDAPPQWVKGMTDSQKSSAAADFMAAMNATQEVTGRGISENLREHLDLPTD
jgi:hypothetical protein